MSVYSCQRSASNICLYASLQTILLLLGSTVGLSQSKVGTVHAEHTLYY